MINIRVATGSDQESVREVHLCAFPKSENQLVADLAVRLLHENTSPATFSLVAEAEKSLVGHIAFSPVTNTTNKQWKGYILAPLGIKPEYQKRNIGSELIRDGMVRLSKMGVHLLFVYGDPDYYGKFGFSSDTAEPYPPPYPLASPFGWQAIILNRDVVLSETEIKISFTGPLDDPKLW